jgi:hypothetical protein
MAKDPTPLEMPVLGGLGVVQGKKKTPRGQPATGEDTQMQQYMYGPYGLGGMLGVGGIGGIGGIGGMVGAAYPSGGMPPGIGFNGVGGVLGTWGNYEQMDRNPTVALAQAVFNAPIRNAMGYFAGINKIFKYDVKGMRIKERGSQPEVPDRWVDAVAGALAEWIPHLLDMCCRALDDGFHAEETVWKHTGDYSTFDFFKPLNPWYTCPMIDRHGALVGIRNAGCDLDDPRRFLWYTYDDRGQYLFGRSRKENYKKAWLQEEILYDLIEKSIRILVLPTGNITFPYGRNPANGQMTDMRQSAQVMAQGLTQGNMTLTPDPFWFDKLELAKNGIAPEKLLPFQTSFYNTHSDSGKGFEVFFRQLDHAIIMGHLLLPRAVLEAQHGSRADSETHTGSGLEICEYVLNQIVRLINRGPVDDFLVLNFGEQARGSVRWVPQPIAGDAMAMNQKMMQNVLGKLTFPYMLRVLDIPAAFARAGVKVAPDFDPVALVDEIEAKEQQDREIKLAGGNAGEPKPTGGKVTKPKQGNSLRKSSRDEEEDGKPGNLPPKVNVLEERLRGWFDRQAGKNGNGHDGHGHSS